MCGGQARCSLETWAPEPDRSTKALALLLSCRVTLNKTLNFSEPQFIHL